MRLYKDGTKMRYLHGSQELAPYTNNRELNSCTGPRMYQLAASLMDPILKSSYYSQPSRKPIHICSRGRSENPEDLLPRYVGGSLSTNDYDVPASSWHGPNGLRPTFFLDGHLKVLIQMKYRYNIRIDLDIHPFTSTSNWDTATGSNPKKFENRIDEY